MVHGLAGSCMVKPYCLTSEITETETRMEWQGYRHSPKETPCPSSSVQPTPWGSLYQERSWWGEMGSSTGPLSSLQSILWQGVPHIITCCVNFCMPSFKQLLWGRIVMSTRASDLRGARRWFVDALSVL